METPEQMIQTTIDRMEVAANMPDILKAAGYSAIKIDLVDYLKERRAATKCECHERDSSYVCKYCYEQGLRGHMQAD